mgnify:CR=1 FL=1
MLTFRIYNQFVHSSRTKCCSNRISNGIGSVDVAQKLAFSLWGISAIFQYNNLWLLNNLILFIIFVTIIGFIFFELKWKWLGKGGKGEPDQRHSPIYPQERHLSLSNLIKELNRKRIKYYTKMIEDGLALGHWMILLSTMSWSTKLRMCFVALTLKKS